MSNGQSVATFQVNNSKSVLECLKMKLIYCFGTALAVYQSTRRDFTGIFLQHRLENIKYRNSNRLLAHPIGSAVYGVGLQPLAC